MLYLVRRFACTIDSAKPFDGEDMMAAAMAYAEQYFKPKHNRSLACRWVGRREDGWEHYLVGVRHAGRICHEFGVLVHPAPDKPVADAGRAFGNLLDEPSIHVD